MSAMSDYLENIITDHLFRTRTFAKPTTIGIALYTVAPGDTGGGTEVTGNNYSRATFTPGDTQWNGTHGNTTGNSSGTGGLSSNAVVLSFPTPSASWGNVVGWGLFDAGAAGNLLIYNTLSVAKTINQGDTVQFAAGTIQVTAA